MPSAGLGHAETDQDANRRLICIEGFCADLAKPHLTESVLETEPRSGSSEALSPTAGRTDGVAQFVQISGPAGGSRMPGMSKVWVLGGALLVTVVAGSSRTHSAV